MKYKLVFDKTRNVYDVFYYFPKMLKGQVPERVQTWTIEELSKILELIIAVKGDWKP